MKKQHVSFWLTVFLDLDVEIDLVLRFSHPINDLDKR